MGTRWLAFPDVRPVYHHLSRCGDASDDSSRPVATTVINVNKRIWNGLSALASSVSIANQPPVRQSGQSAYTQVSSLAPSSETPADPFAPSQPLSPGYVTIVDLVNLSEAYSLYESQKLLKVQEHANLTMSSLQRSEASGSVSECPAPHCSHVCIQKSTLPPATLTYRLSARKDWIDVHDLSSKGSLVAHFLAHRWASVGYLEFNSTGCLLFTSCIQGHSFHVFRIANHPQDSRQSAIHHLYTLDRGSTPCEVVDACFSYDSRWLAVSSNHGTTHVFPITPYGGPVTVRTHIHSHVVNRTSRYQRSAGLEEHHLTKPQPNRLPGNSDTVFLTTSEGSQNSANMSSQYHPVCKAVVSSGNAANLCVPVCPNIGVASELPSETLLLSSTGPFSKCACPLNSNYNTTNPRLPPYPEPCQIQPEARLHPRLPYLGRNSGYASAALNAASGALEVMSSTSGSIGSLPRQTPLVSGRPCGVRMAACFHSPLFFPPSQSQAHSSQLIRKQDSKSKHFRPIDSLFVVTWDMHIVQFDLSVGASDQTTSIDRVYEDGSIKLNFCPVGQWVLRTDVSVRPPFTDAHLLVARLQKPSHPIRSNPPNTADFASESHLDLNSPVASTSMEVSSIRTSDLSNVSVNLPETQDADLLQSQSSFAAAPEGWPSDDASSYWYSQIELNTHMGPLRRLWMGPQFNFRLFPFSENNVPTDDSFLSDSVPPPGTYSPSVPSDYSPQKRLKPPRTSSICATFEEANSCAVDTLAKEMASLSAGQISSQSRLIDPADFEFQDDLEKFRRQSSDILPLLNNRLPPSISNDGRVVIESGSYQDSSPGGSLCSLGFKRVDDLAENLAEAMQDDDIQKTCRTLDGSCHNVSSIISPSLLLLRPHSPSRPFSCSSISNRLSSGSNSLPNQDSLFMLESDPPFLAGSSCNEETIVMSSSLADVLDTIEPDDEDEIPASGVSIIVPNPLSPGASMPTPTPPTASTLLPDSCDSLSSSPSKWPYSLTEPSELSTNEFYSGKQSSSRKKSKSTTFRKRVAVKQIKTTASINESAAVSKSDASESSTRLAVPRKHRQRNCVSTGDDVEKGSNTAV